MLRVEQLEKVFKAPRQSHKLGSKDGVGAGDVVKAVRNVTFSCKAGEVLGLLGPNGAGKTTTLRMLSSALVPTSGSIYVQDQLLTDRNNRLRARIGFLSTNTGLYGRLTARENLSFFAKAYGIENPVARVEQVLCLLGLEQNADVRAESLSFGTKQRLAIARTIVHDPDILILDEPTTGLDIVGSELVASFIKQQRVEGKAIVFSSHHLHEILELCDKICIVSRGESRYEGKIEALLERTSADSLHNAYLNTI